MRTWNDYKEHVKATSPQGKADIEEMEAIAAIISAVIEQRNALGYSQRQLAEMCHIPQSSIARIESCKTVPNLETLVKIMKPLGLTLTAQAVYDLQNQHFPRIINRLIRHTSTANCTVKSHNHGNRTVNLLCGFFFVRLDISGRVTANEDVVHHPP